MAARIRNVLVMLVALFVLGASSQAAVCELTCDVMMQAPECHGADAPAAMAMSMPMAMPGHSAGMAMDHSHCHHAMGTAPMHAMLHQVGESHDAGCNHAAIVAFDKGGSTAVSFVAVQWVAVAVVPVDLSLPASYSGVGQRPPVLGAAVDPLIVSLRV